MNCFCYNVKLLVVPKEKNYSKEFKQVKLPAFLTPNCKWNSQSRVKHVDSILILEHKMLAKIWPTHFKNTSPLLWKISFTLKIWPPLYGKDIHLWRQMPTTTARSKQLRQLHRRCLPICCLDPAVHHREEQGHQEVPWWALRLREDHHRQGWSLGEQWSVTTNQVISGFQSLSLLSALMEK